MGRLASGFGADRTEGKLFHTGRSHFPSYGAVLVAGLQEWARKFKAHQVVTFGVSYPHAFGPQSPGCLGKLSGRGERSAGNFEQNPRGERQRAANCNQRAGCTDIQSSGELEEVFALFITAANKNRNRQGKTRPDTAFRFGTLKCQTQFLSIL